MFLQNGKLLTLRYKI